MGRLSWLRRPGYGALRLLRNSAVLLIVTIAGAQAAPLTVAAMGDSLTQGHGLPADEGFVPTLEEWLRDRGADVEIVNAGVSGDTTAGGLSRVDWTLTEDVDGVLVEFGGNDLLRGIDPEVSRENLSGILSAAEDKGVEAMLVGIEATSNYGTAFKDAFDGMYVELAREYDVPLYRDFFRALRPEGDTEAAQRAFMQPDGIHPNARGVEKIVADIGPAVLDFLDTLD